MSRNLIFNKEVDKFIDSLPQKQYRQVLSKAFGLRSNPRPQDSKKMSGYDDLYRTDTGEYRIIYSFNDREVRIWVIGKRNDDEVYRSL